MTERGTDTQGDQLEALLQRLLAANRIEDAVIVYDVRSGKRTYVVNNDCLTADEVAALYRD